MGKGGHPDTLKIAFLLPLFVAIVVIWTASGSDGAAGEAELFEKAYGYYLNYQPEQAVSAFSLFLDKFTKSPARDAALFWQAKSLIAIGRTEEAKNIFSAIEEEYPESIFRDFARKASEELSLRPGREAGGGIGEVRAKKGSNEQGSEGPAEKHAKPTIEVKELTAHLRESEAKADKVEPERNSATAEIVKAKKERDKAIAALRDAELRLAEANDAAFRLREREKFQKEQDEYMRRLKDEVRALTEGTKKRDERLSENEKTIALLREQLSTRNSAKTETEDRRTERGDRELQTLKKAPEEAAQQIEVLTAKLRDSEKALAEKDDLVKRVSAENAAFADKLKETEALATELKMLRAENGRLKSEVAKAAAAAKDEGPAEKLERQYEEMKRAYETVAERGSRMETEIMALKERIARYETPVVKIGERAYTMPEVVDRSRLAAAVLSKLGTSPSWRKGDVYEDFIAEKLLLAKAGDNDRKKAKDKAEKLAGRYALDRAGYEYLADYLAIEELIGRKRADSLLDEDTMRRYYEAHKTEYVEKVGQRIVKCLVVRYHKGEKLGTIALVSEIQREAGSGKSFEEIAQTRPGKISLRKVKLDELPEWMREKIRGLKAGEISNIFIKDQFLMLQMQEDGPVYRRYEDVRDDIIKKLTLRGEAPLDIETWLAALRKEAGDVR